MAQLESGPSTASIAEQYRAVQASVSRVLPNQTEWADGARLTRGDGYLHAVTRENTGRANSEHDAGRRYRQNMVRSRLGLAQSLIPLADSSEACRILEPIYLDLARDHGVDVDAEY